MENNKDLRVSDPVTEAAVTEGLPASNAQPEQEPHILIPISLREIEMVKGLPRLQRKLWAKKAADQIYKLVRGYQAPKKDAE